VVLRGRAEQLKTPDGLPADVRAGRSRVLVVRGEPGINVVWSAAVQDRRAASAAAIFILSY
jgi:hypothetical protein